MCKELIANLKGENQIGLSDAFSEQLNRLLKSGQLVRIERGIYILCDQASKDSFVVCSENMRRLNQQIKKLLSFIGMI